MVLTDPHSSQSAQTNDVVGLKVLDDAQNAAAMHVQFGRAYTTCKFVLYVVIILLCPAMGIVLIQDELPYLACFAAWIPVRCIDPLRETTTKDSYCDFEEIENCYYTNLHLKLISTALLQSECTWDTKTLSSVANTTTDAFDDRLAFDGFTVRSDALVCRTEYALMECSDEYVTSVHGIGNCEPQSLPMAVDSNGKNATHSRVCKGSHSIIRRVTLAVKSLATMYMGLCLTLGAALELKAHM
jgi:hypothetical protein